MYICIYVYIYIRNIRNKPYVYIYNESFIIKLGRMNKKFIKLLHAVAIAKILTCSLKRKERKHKSLK